MPAINQIGTQIRQQRIARRWSQAELAKHACTNQSAITRIETGKSNPTLTTLEEIAKAMGMRINIRLWRS